LELDARKAGTRLRRTRSHLIAIVGLALPLHGANPARAADADEDERPRPLDITRQVPEVVAGAVERAEPSDDPSSFTEVIQVEDYRGEVASTAELLSRAVGVQVRRFGGPGDPAEISIRGSTSAQVVIQLDGFRLNTAQSGFVDLSTIPLALLDRIEITRGGGSVQAGSGAIGGVVNLVTLRPGGKPRNRVVGTAGSFDTYELSVARAATASGLEYVLGYDGFWTEGDWDFERLESESGIGDAHQQPEREPRCARGSRARRRRERPSLVSRQLLL
jgi:outer membrane cobalamin receptor